jgi:hypothetical protein
MSFAIPDGSLWIPGRGSVPPDIRAAEAAIKEYAGGSDDLGLGRSEIDGTWVVVWNRGPEGRPFPVLNLGRELPGREEIQRRLYESDTWRRGAQIVQQVARKQLDGEERARKENRDRARAAAEDIDTAYHAARRHPTSTRIFVPKSIPQTKE